MSLKINYIGFFISYFLATNTQAQVLYQSNAFSIYSNKVVQGSNVAMAHTPTYLTSNYKSPANSQFSRLISFKLSINEKDNELPVGVNHWVLIDQEKESPIVTFGATPPPPPPQPTTSLPTNYQYTFRVDVSSVLQQMEQQGYYQAYDGSRVAKADFKGFYIAGSAEPLSWDFVNLHNKGLQLQPTADKHIYSITITLNPYNEKAVSEKFWKPDTTLTINKVRYYSDQPLVDALFNLSLEEAAKAVEPDSTFRTGAKWAGVWTRDISYSILLAFAYHNPEVAKISLRKKVKRGRIVQDTGSGGAWPVSSDRTTWILAAWEIYQVTGDEAWLKEVFPIIAATLEDDFKTLYNPATGLYRGESSFLDWREQTYPKWMNNADIYVSENLGTNAVHYQAHVIASNMAKLLGNQQAVIFAQRAERIKKAINQVLWLPQQQWYAQYTYGRHQLMVSPRFEALGEALSILFNIADANKAKAIIANAPLTTFGTTCIYPQIPNIPPYHNNGIWPFVQAYWNLAAAKAGNEKALVHGLAAIYRAAGLFLTNYENMVATTGDFLGTEINSDRMLWSMAGNLAMVHRVFMGMQFSPQGVQFQPVVPKVYAGIKTLTHFQYRKATLNITVKGYGNKIASIIIDGKPANKAFIPANITGHHTVVIQLANNSFDNDDIQLVDNHTTLPNPQPKLTGQQLAWPGIEGAVRYEIFRNGKLYRTTQQPSLTVNVATPAQYQVTAIDRTGQASFASEPLVVGTKPVVLECEAFTARYQAPYANYQGDGFIKTSNTDNRVIHLTVNVDKAGKYLLDVRYSNGSGPWNTDNKCAIRSLYVNNRYEGVLVMPQRGKDEWSDWGFSNATAVTLQAGKNVIEIHFKPWNENMNVDVNTAMLDYVRLTPAW